MSELQIPFEALRDQINSAIDVIVQVDRYADGGRRVSELAVVASSRRETFRLASVMEFVSDPVGPDRRVTGRVEHRRLPDAIARRLMLAGQQVPPEFARRATPVVRSAGDAMTSASWAMLLLLASGVLGLLGLWQLLAGTSRRAELAARGRAGGSEGGGRSLVRALDARLRRTAQRPAARLVARWARA